MKYLLSVLILAACLNFNLTNLTGQAHNLTGQAHADEQQTNNLDSALFGYWYGESIPIPMVT